jgi:sugar/nucleoside kinase (ribokinase family)
MEPEFIIAGHLRRDYLLPPTGNPRLDVAGGNLLYAAGGLGVWNTRIGLMARVGEDYPQEWLRDFERHGWDTRGIHIMPGPLDLRSFRAWSDFQHIQTNNPVAHFGRLGLLFPKSLLGFQSSEKYEDDRQTPQSPSTRPSDIPEDYLNAHSAHVCGVEYATACRLLSWFRQGNVTTLTLDPFAGYMNTGAFEDVRILFQGLTALLVSEEKLRGLFWGRTDDLWQMAEAVGNCGCEIIVIKRGPRGQWLYEHASRKRWEIPAYPARLYDPTGAGDSFCGGFTAGFRETYDPLRAVLYGSVSASLTIEGCGPFHALEALPGLAKARFESLTGVVRQV